MDRGDKFRKMVTVLKVLKDLPTVISVDGRVYAFVLRQENQYKHKPKGGEQNGRRKSDVPRSKNME